MSDARTEPVQYSSSIVTAHCMDCGEQFTGNLGVRFIETPLGKGIEILVRDGDSRSAHSITRIKCDCMPTVSIAWVSREHGTA